MSDNVEKQKRKISSVFVLIFFIISLISNGYLIYNIFLLSGIENLIRYIIIGFIIIVGVLNLIKTKNIWKNKQPKKKRKKESKRIGYIIFLILYSVISLFIGFAISYIYGQVNNINKKYVTYSSSLVVLKDNQVENISEVKDFKIGILNDKKSPDGYIIPQEIIKKNKLHDNNDITEYENYTEMITDLYLKEIDAIFISTDYANIYNNISGYENIKEETKIVITKEKEMLKSKTSKEENSSAGKSVQEPFTILLMGIDSTDEVLTKNAVANGDSLILITFNPKTLNATMLSIPRDSYVPIACWPSKAENKITHAAAYGNDCMINTIEDFFDVDIDYYAKINFKGLVKLVDALGGIDVEVPKDLCTDDSSRGQQICIKGGYQHLNGEEALVLSRNRKQLVNGDFGRGQNQQLVIQAMLEKIKTLRSVNQFTSILNTVSNSLDTNLTTKQILSFYSIAKDILKIGLSSENSNIINIQQLYLQGHSAMIYDSSIRMELYNYVPNTYSKKDIIKAMKMNLELIGHNAVKSFSFSINEPYEKQIIGYGPYKSTFDSSKYKKAPKEEPKKDVDDCGENEEIGADGISCVCKWGYIKVNGKCTEDKEEEIKDNDVKADVDDDNDNDNDDDLPPNNNTDIPNNSNDDNSSTTDSNEPTDNQPTE